MIFSDAISAGVTIMDSSFFRVLKDCILVAAQLLESGWLLLGPS
jgi:hypothetical protein